MTGKELLEALQKMTEEELECEVMDHYGDHLEDIEVAPLEKYIYLI